MRSLFTRLLCTDRQHTFFQSVTATGAGKVSWSIPGKHIQLPALCFRQALKLPFNLSIMYHCLSLSKILLPAELWINAS